LLAHFIGSWPPNNRWPTASFALASGCHNCRTQGGAQTKTKHQSVVNNFCFFKVSLQKKRIKGKIEWQGGILEEVALA